VDILVLLLSSSNKVDMVDHPLSSNNMLSNRNKVGMVGLLSKEGSMVVNSSSSSSHIAMLVV
jgi:hypothetical protein